MEHSTRVYGEKNEETAKIEIRLMVILKQNQAEERFHLCSYDHSIRFVLYVSHITTTTTCLQTANGFNREKDKQTNKVQPIS